MQHRLRTLLTLHITRRILLAIGIYAAFFVWAHTGIDPDFGWHLRSGQYSIAHGIPATDIYTYTAASFPWVNHEWLSDSILALLYSIGSYSLVIAIYAGMWTAAVLIAGRKAPASLLVVATGALLVFSGVRALTWSALLLVILILLLHQANRRWRYAIPLLVLAWANLHGSFLVGIAYTVWQAVRERSWKLLAVVGVALPLTLITPYGLALYGEIFQTMLDTSLSGRIAEWAHFSIPFASAGYCLVWLGITIACHGRNWREYIRFDTLLFAMSVMSMRMVPLFVLASLPLLARDIRILGKRMAHMGAPVAARRRTARIAAVSVGVAAPLLLLVDMASWLPSDSAKYPDAAIAYLRHSPCKGRLFNSYDVGGYLIWQLPSHKVYIDGRMPSWRHGDTVYMDNYMRILTDAHYRKEQFTYYNVTCVLIENTAEMRTDLVRKGWQVRVNDGYTSLLLAS